MRNRAGCIIIENDRVVLIKRVRENQVYYVFPGGGINPQETPEEAAKREAFEELGVTIQINNSFDKIHYNGLQYYFLANIIGGRFGTGKGEE